MGLILWIDKNTFATSLIEKVFKKRDLPFYTIPHARDFVYLVEDLKPSVIVLDGSTVREDLVAFKQQYEASPLLQKMPYILLECGDEVNFISTCIGTLKRPLDPFQLPQTLSKLLNKTH